MLSFGFFIEDEQCPRLMMLVVLMMLAFLIDDIWWV
jgi:hypothetical protein